jgi:hypothetical protein
MVIVFDRGSAPASIHNVDDYPRVGQVIDRGLIEADGSVHTLARVEMPVHSRDIIHERDRSTFHRVACSKNEHATNYAAASAKR